MTTDKTSLGDRIKDYERNDRFMPMLPIIARLDGRSFHNFCKNLRKPYDERLTQLMVAVTKYLVAETQALMGYTQSDEITLVWYSADPESKVFFDGRVDKMTSILSAMASVEFNRLLPEFLPEKVKFQPLFDCRVFQVPNQTEASNCFLWRERDATKNSINSAGQFYFSHKELQGKHGGDIQEMLFSQKGINWNDYPDFFKRGTWVQRHRVMRPFTTGEISKLPPKHAARTNPELEILRWEIRELDMPPFGTVANKEEVIFEGEEIDSKEIWRAKRRAALEALEAYDAEDDLCAQTKMVINIGPRHSMSEITLANTLYNSELIRSGKASDKHKFS